MARINYHLAGAYASRQPGPGVMTCRDAALLYAVYGGDVPLSVTHAAIIESLVCHRPSNGSVCGDTAVLQSRILDESGQSFSAC
mmetsp:Transcript_24810/g.54068  ORF Transcript_24810/g.54068 Transcript_24810/m.54068 type:complete len:84 (+) Transcript_24810:174-425(+)